MMFLKLFFLIVFLNYEVDAALNLDIPNPAMDLGLYDDVLDSKLCAKHLEYISKNVDLHFKFIDRGLRIPKAITEGNTADFGSYHACLAISESLDDDVIEGKYCMIKVPLAQDLKLPSFPEIPSLPEWPELPWPNKFTDDDFKIIREFEERREGNRILFGGKTRDKNHKTNSRNDNGTNIDLSYLSLKMGMCLPRACTTREAFEKLYVNLSLIGFEFEDQFCRLPDDKPWTPADFVSITLLCLIGVITILSTWYDIHKSIIKKDPKGANPTIRAFSVYTNTRRLLTFNSNPNAIECIDGIRAFAMAWVILGHTFSAVSADGFVANLLDVAVWTSSAKSLWLMSAPITVDTFFTLSGLLIVYTTAGKMTGAGLLKNLHLFYLNRLLRLFPVLAFTVLLQMSVINRISDGPYWAPVAHKVNSCRVYWWTNFLYIQNYVNSDNLCLIQTWYLTVDTQLQIISPLVLYWVLSGNKRQAWIGLIGGLIISLSASTIYIFMKDFHLLYEVDTELAEDFMTNYYINTLTRAPPFFVGMIFGYLLHLGRNKKIVISKGLVATLWAFAAGIAAMVIYTYYYQANIPEHNRFIAGVINSFTRPAWAVAIGWMIFACKSGYGGPINWILSLSQLKLAARVSYAMYLVHYPILSAYIGSAVTTFYFDVASWVYLFLSHFTMSFICGCIITVLVESPASIFIKRMFSGGPKKHLEPEKRNYANQKANGAPNNNYFANVKTKL